MAKVERGEAKVVVGARSSHLCSFKNIGAIIIDEEHEASYKQDSNPRYHARDVAVPRARVQSSSLASWICYTKFRITGSCNKGVYELIRLTQRANPQPKFQKLKSLIFVIILAKMEAGNFTPVLVEAIADRLQKKSRLS